MTSLTQFRGAAAAHFEITALSRPQLSEIADFIYRFRIQQASKAANAKRVAPESAGSIERRLEWLLVDNPVRSKGAPLGYCVRDRFGAMRGIDLCFPSAFLTEDQRVVGLGSGSFFVEPAAQCMGFYLFKKVLAAREPAFFFATTCNANSEPLWQMLGGCAIPDSETEYVLPLRLDNVIPAFLDPRNRTKTASRIAGWIGSCTNPLLRALTHRSSPLVVTPCRDYEKLATLFRRHRDPRCTTVDRSIEFLEWRYGPGSPAHPCDLYTVRDRHGNEAWVALGRLVHGNVRGRLLLDAVWPREKMSLRDLFRAILRLTSDADAFFFRRQPGFDVSEYCRFALAHRLDARTFVIAPKNGMLPAPELFDYDDNDYIAWIFQWNDDGVRRLARRRGRVGA